VRNCDQFLHNPRAHIFCYSIVDLVQAVVPVLEHSQSHLLCNRPNAARPNLKSDRPTVDIFYQVCDSSRSEISGEAEGWLPRWHSQTYITLSPVLPRMGLPAQAAAPSIEEHLSPLSRPPAHRPRCRDLRSLTILIPTSAHRIQTPMPTQKPPPAGCRLSIRPSQRLANTIQTLIPRESCAPNTLEEKLRIM